MPNRLDERVVPRQKGVLGVGLVMQRSSLRKSTSTTFYVIPVVNIMATRLVLDLIHDMGVFWPQKTRAPTLKQVVQKSKLQCLLPQEQMVK